MTSGVPWQIKGVSRHTREAACEAARRSGIPVSEWLDRVILDLALQDGVDPRRFAQSSSDPHDDGGDQDAPPSCHLGWAVKPLCDDLAKISLMLRETVPRKAVEALESEVRKLADRVEYTRYAGGDGTGLASDVREAAKTREALRAVMPAESLLGIARAVQQLSQKVAKLIERLDASDARLNHLEAIERGLAELLVHFARQRVPNLARVAAPPDLDALSHDLAELRRTEKKTQDSLEAVRGMLGHVVDRLAVIETDMRGKAAARPDATPAPKADWLAPAAQMTSKPHSAPEKPATPSTADPASTVPMTPESAAFSATEHGPIDPSLPPDHPVEMAAGKARGERPALPADRVPASESELGAVELSVNPDCGGKSDFIAAARRAAQAGRDVAPANDASAADGSASDVGRLRALIGGTAAILVVVGLLQIARILVAPSDGVKLTMPSDTAVSRDAPPPAVEAAASAAGLASPASAALFPAGRPSAIFSTAAGAAVATSETSILVPVWTPEQEPEATGRIQTSRHRSDRAGPTTTASAPASAKPAPPAAPLNLDLAMPGPAQ